VRKQSARNRQGGEEVFRVGEAGPKAEAAGTDSEHRTAEEFLRYLDDAEKFYERYESLTGQGVSRELARIALPVSVYTEWYWKCDLHNLLRFLALRLDAHAQLEIREYAAAMLRLVEPIVPHTIEAWRDYELESVQLSRSEIEAIRSHQAGVAPDLAVENRREQAEWAAKRDRLGLSGSK
jgi:thymidylate synthase (FAD)